MINNSDIQASWIAKLKANSAVTALVPAIEIREDKWKGTDFSYPNIRVKLGSLTPTTSNSNCQSFKSEVSILVFTEQKSSKQADEIAGVIATQFWSHPFNQGVVRFTSVNLDAIIPADVPERDLNSWLSEVHFSCLVQNT